jgi:hypothetical protein
VDSKVLDKPLTIVGGDFNLTMFSREIWGVKAQLDNLNDFFTSSFEKVKLVDMEPIKLVPTWRNFIMGDVAIGKCLDVLWCQGSHL